MQERSLATSYLKTVHKEFEKLKQLAEKAMNQLQPKDFYFAPNEATNSIAILIQHLSGNMISRWTDFLTTDGEKEYRDRDAEFFDNHLSNEQLWDHWNKGWSVLFQTLESLTPDDLMKTVKIRSEDHLVIEAIERQMSHYSGHIGQIIYMAKIILGDQFQVLTIPLGASKKYNEEMVRKFSKREK